MKDYVSPEWTQVALLTIDVQQDFTLPGAPAEIPGTMAAVPNIQRLLQAFRTHHKPIIHVVRLYLSDGSNVDICRRQTLEQRAHVVLAENPGAELVEVLKPSAHIKLETPRLLAGHLQIIGSQEWCLYKPRWGAFYQTALEQHLRSLQISTVVVCGCNFPHCPRATIYEASERDFRVVFIADATSGAYQQGIQELRNIGVAVMTVQACVEALSPPNEIGLEL